MGHSFRPLHGGKGSNQAVGCSRLGASVKLIASIGRDTNGEKALALYEQESVDSSPCLISEEKPTGVGFIIVNDDGNNIITLDPGANNDLTPAYIQQKKEDIAGADVLLIQLEIPPETVYATARLGAENNVKVIVNPAPYSKLPDDIWQYITILTPNETEAKLTLGYLPDEEIPVEQLAEGLIAKGVQNVVITLGEKGSYFVSRNRDLETGYIPAVKVETVDTTGAGDTFNAALGVAIAEGLQIHEAVKFASAAAARSVTKYGVIESMPYRNEVSQE